MRSMHLIRSLWFALLKSGLVTLAVPAPSFAQFAVSVTIAPPMLPVYAQPVIPGNGYLWTPGYWAWSPDNGDYYWVPGTWVQPPQAGVLWTPGYWGWGGNAFMWNAGYWGQQIGFYGGINYGFGYTGSGYAGGYWNNGAFYYNRSVNNITNVTNITNVYNKTVVNNVTVNNVSYNGGRGGITAQPSAVQRTAASERHVPPTAEQAQHQNTASTNRALLASVNHGKPPVAATSKPGVFSGSGVVAAKAAAPYHSAAPAAANRTAARSPNPAGGGTSALVSAHPAPSHSTAKPAPTTERVASSGGTNQPAQPRSKGGQPKTAAAEHVSEPPPRSAPSPAVAQHQSAPHPPAAQHQSAPAPKSESHPGGE